MESVKKQEPTLNLKGEIICEIQNVKTSLIDNFNDPIKEGQTGTLQIIYFESSKIYIFKINQDVFSFYKSIQVYVTAYENQRSYIFPHQKQIQVLLIQNQQSSNFDIIEAILDDCSSLIYNDNKLQKTQEQTVNQILEEQKVDEIPKKVENEVIIQPKQEKSFANEALVSTGNAFSYGISLAGNFFSSAIKHTGNFIESNITNPKEVKISEKTKEDTKKLKSTTGKVIEFTGNTAKSILEMNVQLAKFAGKFIFEDLFDMKNDDNNKTSKFKEFGDIAVSKSLEVLNALDFAADKVGQQLQQTTQKIVEKKYGKETGEVAKDGISVITDINKAYGHVGSVKGNISRQGKKIAKEIAKDQL